MRPENQQPIEILLAEDNPGDVRLTEKAFEQGNLLNNLHVVNDGVEAMKFLRQEGEYETDLRPDLVLLDLDMPRMDGKAVLEELKADSDFKHIPVVVLTSSDAEEDIISSFDRNADAYLTKPVDFDGLMGVVHRIEDLWLTVVKVPMDGIADEHVTPVLESEEETR